MFYKYIKFVLLISNHYIHYPGTKQQLHNLYYGKKPTSITAIDSNNDEFTSSYGRGHFANNLVGILFL